MELSVGPGLSCGAGKLVGKAFGSGVGRVNKRLGLGVSKVGLDDAAVLFAEPVMGIGTGEFVLFMDALIIWLGAALLGSPEIMAISSSTTFSTEIICLPLRSNCSKIFKESLNSFTRGARTSGFFSKSQKHNPALSEMSPIVDCTFRRKLLSNRGVSL